MGFGDTGDLCVGDEIDGVGASSVFRQGGIFVIDETSAGIEDDVLEDGSETDGVEDLRFLLGRQSDTLLLEGNKRKVPWHNNHLRC